MKAGDVLSGQVVRWYNTGGSLVPQRGHVVATEPQKCVLVQHQNGRVEWIPPKHLMPDG